MIRRLLFISLFGALFVLGAPPAQANGHHGDHHGNGFLFAGTDEEEFGGARNGPDRLGRFGTRGPNVVDSTIITTSYPINGMGNAHGFLYSGDPYSNTIRRISYDGSLLGTTVGTPAACCSEDMILVGRFLYHAHWSSRIDKVNPLTGALVQTYAQSDVVGMALVSDEHEGDDDHGSKFGRFDLTGVLGWAHHGDDEDDSQIWITKWGGRHVGTWDPATNTFTPRFTTPADAGGLAWDSKRRVLWVGLQGGTVVPYSLNGTPYNAGFQPFGPLGSETVDGLEFVKRIHKHHNNHDH